MATSHMDTILISARVQNDASLEMNVAPGLPFSTSSTSMPATSAKATCATDACRLESTTSPTSSLTLCVLGNCEATNVADSVASSGLSGTSSSTPIANNVTGQINQPTSHRPHPSSTTVIVGSVCGVAAAGVLIAFAAWLIRKKQKRRFFHKQRGGGDDDEDGLDFEKTDLDGNARPSSNTVQQGPIAKSAMEPPKTLAWHQEPDKQLMNQPPGSEETPITTPSPVTSVAVIEPQNQLQQNQRRNSITNPDSAAPLPTAPTYKPYSPLILDTAAQSQDAAATSCQNGQNAPDALNSPSSTSPRINQPHPQSQNADSQTHPNQLRPSTPNNGSNGSEGKQAPYTPSLYVRSTPPASTAGSCAPPPPSLPQEYSLARLGSTADLYRGGREPWTYSSAEEAMGGGWWNREDDSIEGNIRDGSR